MPVTPQNLARSYKNSAIETASPEKLILMLFDGALRFMHSADEGFQEEDCIRRNELINNNILRAQKIISELQASLNMKIGGEFADTMYRLYDFVNEQLMQANLKKLQEPLRDSQRIISELRGAWAEMLAQQSSAATHG
ncbi:MAG: flagellar export chaperone FliS [Opitutales bacterium]|tara:strand:- start:280 stop:693 length:414 start_codon:yes stop_codon:yes gene_type:complete